MKKTMSLLLVAGLSWFTIGCSGDPGVSVDTEVPEAEAAEMDDMGGDIASEAALEAGDAGGGDAAAGDAAGGAETPPE